MAILKQSEYHINKMDCPSEEQMIRMKLEALPDVLELKFDIPNRNLLVIHKGTSTDLTKIIGELKLGEKLINENYIDENQVVYSDDSKQRKALWIVLIINFGLFIVEMLFGWISNSMGLVGDSLDMLADSFVYALSLMAVGKAISRKKYVAKLSGYFQISLAILGIFEVTRRSLFDGEIPLFQNMIIISVIALIGNIISLYIIQKNKSNEAHMKASSIFTSNDIVINIGVIAAGVLVYLLEKRIPDLVIGCIVFLIVLRGAFRILKLAK